MEPAKKLSPAEVKLAVADYFKDHNISMADAGLKMGMSRASVSYALSVTDRYFKLFQALKYSAAFGMSTEFLTKGEGELLEPGIALRDMMDKVVERNEMGTVIPKNWKEQILQHEERRYNKAVSDLADLETILRLLESAINHGHFFCKRYESKQGAERYSEESVLRARQRISEYEKARAYIFERISAARRIISDIEEKRFQREHPELVEKAEDKPQGENTENAANDSSHFFFFFDFDNPEETEGDDEQ